MAVSDQEYTLLAGAAYLSNKSYVNQFPVPDGWIRVNGKPLIGSMGFETSLFQSAMAYNFCEL